VARSRPLPWDPIAEARQNWREWGWAEAADGMATVTSIMRVHQILLARIDAALKPHGLSFARFEMLRLLGFAKDHRMPMARARDLLQVHPASITNVVDRLETDGLVERVAHPDDGRSVLIQLTSRGAGLVAAATASLNAEVFEDVGLSNDELAGVAKAFAAFRQRAGDFELPAAPPDPL